MFGLKLFKRRLAQPDLSVAVLRGLLEAHHASRSPQETYQELMRIGNKELRPDGWIQPQQAPTPAKEVDDANSVEELETERLVRLLEAQSEQREAG